MMKTTLAFEDLTRLSTIPWIWWNSSANITICGSGIHSSARAERTGRQSGPVFVSKGVACSKDLVEHAAARAPLASHRVTITIISKRDRCHNYDVLVERRSAVYPHTLRYIVAACVRLYAADG